MGHDEEMPGVPGIPEETTTSSGGAHAAGSPAADEKKLEQAIEALAAMEDELARERAISEFARRLGVPRRVLRNRVARAATKRGAEGAADRSEDEEAPIPYTIAGGVICRRTEERGLTPLANFRARIVAEVIRDDGAERKVYLTLEGQLQTGEPLPRVTVPADRYPAMAWVPEAWGSRAVVHAGQMTRDHLRAAIQLLSRSPQRRTVYGHLGWRQVGGRWLFLHAGGALGASGPVEGVEVDPPDALAGYRLPDPLEGARLREALERELELLDVAPDTVTAPLLLAVWRAPLAELYPADYAVWVAGPTQARKSSVTALAQAHYGSTFDRLHLPASWSSTPNALEAVAHAAKDVYLTVDDFAPRGTQAEVDELHRKAERLIRAVGNQSGRMRLALDGSSIKPTYHPRGLVVSTGEDLPRGQSVRARLLIAEVEKGQVDLAKLSAAQALAADGVYAGAQAAYIRHLAGNLDGLRRHMAPLHERLRYQLACKGIRDRAGDQIANLLLGLAVWLRFAERAGLPEATLDAAKRRIGAAVLALGWAQPGYQETEDPADRALGLLAAVLASGRAHLAPAAGSGPAAAAGELIGWATPQGEVLLEPDAAYAAIQRLAHDQGQPIGVTQRTLWRRLAERGLVVTGKEDGRVRYTIKRTVAGSARRLLVLTADGARIAGIPLP